MLQASFGDGLQSVAIQASTALLPWLNTWAVLIIKHLLVREANEILTPMACIDIDACK